MNAAQAEIDREQHAAADAHRRTAGAALAAFYRVLHAREVVQATREQADLSGELLSVAEARYQEGDIPLLHVKLALAELDRRPEMSLSLGYEYEEGANILLAGFSISLPVFNQGQGRREVLGARLLGARLEEEAVRTSIDSQIRGARLGYRAAVEAARGLESEGVPLQAGNAQLALAAYRAGKIDLASLLLIRRESLDLQREDLDRQLAASLAGVEFALASGALPIHASTVPPEGDPIRKGD